MKLCKDCKWCEGDGDSALCNMAAATIHPVTGRATATLCIVERASICAADCGPDAKHFTPNHPVAAAG